MKLFKRKKKIMKCPKCGSKMTLTNGLSRTFQCKGQSVEVSDITGMLCADCNEVMFDWPEAHRIEKFVHEAVGWEDKEK